jgi:hypothetical protein
LFSARQRTINLVYVDSDQFDVALDRLLAQGTEIARFEILL